MKFIEILLLVMACVIALVDLGVAMGPVIASIHQMREDLRVGLKDAAQMETAPKLRRLRPDEVG